MSTENFQFSHAAIKLLAEAGWFPGRSVPTYDFETSLIRQGAPVLEEAVRFFSEFGNLTILLPPAGARRETTSISFKILVLGYEPHQLLAIKAN
jgi:hypothetical protein